MRRPRELRARSPGDHGAAAMSASDSIDGLIKWAQHEPWVDDFEATFERQIGPACRRAGVAPDDLAETIGTDLATSLWGWAFEDFVSSRRGERNVADDYLKRRGWKESAGARAYIRALRNSTVSLYEVSDVVAGESFLARDLVRGGEPVRVFERSATRSLSQWDRIAARVVTVLGKTQILGAVLPFSRPWRKRPLLRLSASGKRRPRRRGARRVARPECRRDLVAPGRDARQIHSLVTFIRDRPARHSLLRCEASRTNADNEEMGTTYPGAQPIVGLAQATA